MREIEVKAKVHNSNKLLLAAEAMGIEFGNATIQEDTTYESDFDYSSRENDWTIFRIRLQNGIYTLTMKHPASKRSRDNFEQETVIEDPEAMIAILNRVGFHQAVRINKKRRIAKYKNYEVCLDEVEDLGSFIEIEKLTDENDDVDAVQEELMAILEQLSIRKEDRVHKGYDKLMHEFLAQKM